MEYIKKKSKILVKDDFGRIVQIIPETDSSAVTVDGDSLTNVLEQIENEKADVVHGHNISDISNLQASLDGKEPLITEISNEEILNLLDT